MSLFGLAIRNIRGNRFRSWVVFLCILGLAGFFVSTTLIIRGAEYSLTRGMGRLGADIMIVPLGAETAAEGAILVGKVTGAILPPDVMAKVSAVPGVAAVTPQLYVAAGNDFMVAFDPRTDFAVLPWLPAGLQGDLGTGQAICGSAVEVSTDGKVNLFGQQLTMRGRLDGTGTSLDRAVFVSFEGAQQVVAAARAAGVPLEVRPNGISALLVRIAPGYDASKISLYIGLNMGVAPVQSPEMLGWFRDQMSGLLWGFVTVLAIIWVLAMAAIGLVFSMVTNERRRHIAVLRAIGATRSFIFRSLLLEALVMAAAAGVAGIALGGLGVLAFSGQIASSIGIPFLFPPLVPSLELFGASLALAIVTAVLASFVPVFRVSRMEPAIAMRE